MRVLFVVLSFVLCMYVQAAEPPPLADFFQNRAIVAAKLSPSGRHVAVLVNTNNGRDQLGVIGLEDKDIKLVAGFRDGDVGNFEWVNDERLVYDSRDKQSAPGEQRYAPGLYAINRDGTRQRRLVDSTSRGPISDGTPIRTLPYNTYMLNQRGSQDGDTVYVLQPEVQSLGNTKRIDLLKLDTVTGRSSYVKGPEGDVMGWMLDAKGQPRIATTHEKNQVTFHYLDPDKNSWRALASFDMYGGVKFAPHAFAPDGTLYVTHNKGDKSVLAPFDLASGKPAAQATVALDEYDFNGHLIVNNDKLLGVRYLGDAQATAWFDPKMKEVQAKVDAKLNHTINLIDVPLRAATPWVLVHSYSDRQPETLILYNSDTDSFRALGETQPRIKPSQMAAMDLVRYKARDGMQIPAWLTVPNESKGKRLPLVVLVHGGPYVRGHEWKWNPEAQFLASRGYAVLEPEFRGSRGFGFKHFRAGWKQWGLAMQDDLADGVAYAVEQGIADPKRICIMGASYGGYATLMGLVRHPELYQCGVDWVGVTDLNLLYNGHWTGTSDMNDTYKQYGFPVLIGDPVKDAAQFKATSPLEQAARITQPLLLAYGGVDHRVPVFHGRKFHDAVKATNKDVEYVVYEDEAHGWSLPATRIDFWGRVEKFLKRQIGTP